MNYRGEDLDLRTPQTWSGFTDVSTSEITTNGPRTGVRSGPILVDDTVLSCCNHAYDIAVAHRAGEVRIEHLIYAMTRVDAAIDALDLRGIRLSGLRRDVAAVVASEIPVSLPNGKGSPRRSEELADVLRLAGLLAQRRNAPAGIDDVLNVLLEQRPELPGAGLLARHVGRQSYREAVEPVTRYVTEPRYMRTVVEPRYVYEQPRYRVEAAQSITDQQQNSRIEALEQLVRSLSADLAQERGMLSGLLKDLSKETQAQRDDQGRLQMGLFDRIQTLEQSLMDRGGDGVSVEPLVGQLRSIESGLELRLKEMAQSWAVLSSRLHELESAVRDRQPVHVDFGPMMRRLDAIEADVRERRGQSVNVDLNPISHRLDVIEEAVLSREGSPNGDVLERLRAVENQVSWSAQQVNERFDGLTARFNDLPVSVGGGGFSSNDMDQLTGALSSATGQINVLGEQLGERLGAVERALAGEIETAAAKHRAYAQDLTEVHDALMKLNQNQHTLAGSMDQWRTDAAGDIAMIANRLNAVDRDTSMPTETLNNLSYQMDQLSQMTIERYHRRNRFWYWLFGTDDWIGASWPSQAAALEAEKARLRAIRAGEA